LSLADGKALEFDQKRSNSCVGHFVEQEKRHVAINPLVINIGNSDAITKRTILSVAKRFSIHIDFTCPTPLLPKLLIKELWTEKVDWDAEIADNQNNRFTSWIKELPVLNQIEIPRKLGRDKLTLHTFCDASGFAYAAAILTRIEYENGVNVRLLNARSQIASEKATISRLELMAATIAVRLTVVKSLTRRILKTTFWSDSTTVLTWIERDVRGVHLSHIE